MLWRIVELFQLLEPVSLLKIPRTMPRHFLSALIRHRTIQLTEMSLCQEATSSNLCQLIFIIWKTSNSLLMECGCHLHTGKIGHYMLMKISVFHCSKSMIVRTLILMGKERLKAMGMTGGSENGTIRISIKDLIFWDSIGSKPPRSKALPGEIAQISISILLMWIASISTTLKSMLIS